VETSEQNQLMEEIISLEPQIKRLADYLMRGKNSSSFDVGDIVSETYINALNGLSNFRGDGKLFSWLLRIAVNTFLDLLKKDKFGNEDYQLSLDEPIDENDTIYNIPDPNDIPLDYQLFQVENRKILNILVLQLSLHHQKVIILFYYGEYSYTEIAKNLNIPLGTIKSQMNRARKELRILYKKLPEDEKILSTLP
jgi:RNA polymerase sigma-70 factor (ECF subfamily)